MSWLDQQAFRTVIQHTPLVAIDLIVENSVGEILLGKRCNRPAQRQWFVPGGRITKDETIPAAFSRLTEVELGLSIPMDRALFQGVYEHHYPDNFVDESFSTHYVVLAYHLPMELDLNELPVDQHNAYRWWPQVALLGAEEVHRHTKWYFGTEHRAG